MDASNFSLISSDASPQCGIYETYPLARFVCIVVAGFVSIVGIAFNVLLIFLFANKSCATTPPTLFPSAIALLDAIMCISYTLLFFLDAIISYLKIESLFLLYYKYLIPAWCISRMTQICIPYMLIFATLERLVWISQRRQRSLLSRMYSRRGRWWTIGATMLVCALARLPHAWALEVVHYPNCTDFFRTMTTEGAKWTQDAYWWKVYDWYILGVVQTVLPLFLLVIFNVIIVCKLCVVSPGTGESAPLDITAPFHKGTQGRSSQTQLRSAITTMVAIVISYLLCNTMQLILTVLENQQHHWLSDDADPEKSSTFHTVFSDLCSFLFMTTSAMRLVIYAVCNTEIRHDIFAFCGWRLPPRPARL